jgi:hypothetical protein
MATRIGFSTSKTSWISRIIRWFTSSTVSHTFIVYYDEEWKRDMVMESEGGMGGSVRIVRFNPASTSIVKIVTPKYDIEVGMNKMVDNLGEVYDYTGLFGMAWVELGKWLKRKWRNPWHSSKNLFCSELVAQVLRDSGYPGSEQLDPGSTDPEMLLKFFEQEASGTP